MKLKALAIGLALATVAVGGAQAEYIRFTIDWLQPVMYGTAEFETVEFEVSDEPIPVPSYFAFFAIYDDFALVDGSPTRITVYFPSFSDGGICSPPLFCLSGGPVYTVSDNRLTFVPGVYEIWGDLYGGYGDVVTISDTNLPIPEPSTWAMALLGFAGLGLTGYRRASAGLRNSVGTTQAIPSSRLE
jgi:hypothetical protein